MPFNALEPPRTGVGRYVWETARALDALLPEGSRFYVYARRPVELPGPAPRWTLRAEPAAAAGRLPAVAWLLARAGALARADALDVFWAAGTLAPPGLGGVPAVATVYDLNHLVVPDTMPLGPRLANAALLGRSLRRAAAVVAISRGTAARVERAYGVRCDAVATPAVGAPFGPPPSSSSTRKRPLSDRRAASAQPAEPAPTTTKSNSSGLVAATGRSDRYGASSTRPRVA